MSDKQELSSAKIEQGWRDTFSTENPFCPCNLKSFTKAVRWAERAMLQAAPAEPQPTCVWHQDGDETSDTWATQCGKYFSLNDGSPSENHMNYCHYCGKPLEELPFTDEDDADDVPASGEPCQYPHCGCPVRASDGLPNCRGAAAALASAPGVEGKTNG